MRPSAIRSSGRIMSWCEGLASRATSICNSEEDSVQEHPGTSLMLRYNEKTGRQVSSLFTENKRTLMLTCRKIRCSSSWRFSIWGESALTGCVIGEFITRIPRWIPIRAMSLRVTVEKLTFYEIYIQSRWSLVVIVQNDAYLLL